MRSSIINKLFTNFESNRFTILVLFPTPPSPTAKKFNLLLFYDKIDEELLSNREDKKFQAKFSHSTSLLIIRGFLRGTRIWMIWHVYVELLNAWWYPGRFSPSLRHFKYMEWIFSFERFFRIYFIHCILAADMRTHCMIFSNNSVVCFIRYAYNW